LISPNLWYGFLFRVEVIPAAEGTDVDSHLRRNAPSGIPLFDGIDDLFGFGISVLN
jgi:hypothetical protein